MTHRGLQLRIENAEREIRRLQRVISGNDIQIEALRLQRLLLAKLAAKTPRFDNPLIAMKAEEIRDHVLADSPVYAPAQETTP